MTLKSDKLIEQYLYDVVRRLPEKQRKDIEQELRTLIEDMIEERLDREEAPGTGYGQTGGTNQEESRREECVKAVLSELGNPLKLAGSYLGENACLISGEYYDSYCFVLKIVLICVGAGIIAASIVSILADGISTGMTSDLWNSLVNIVSLPMALVTAFGIVTLIYAVMERNQVKVRAGEEPWTLEKLPQIPYKKAVIHKGDCVAGIVFTALLAIILIAVPQLFGARIRQGDELVSIPMFNLSIWNQVLPFFMIAIIAGIVDESVKLAAGRYNYTVMLVNIVSNVINGAAAIIIFKGFPIWNMNFAPVLKEEMRNIFEKEINIILPASDIIVLIIIFSCLLDAGVTVYRTLRYGERT